MGEVRLGGHDHLVAAGEVADGAAENLLARAAGVHVGGVEEVDAQLHRVLQQRGPLGVLQPSPPVGGDGPNPEPHFGEDEIGSRQLSEFHSQSASNFRCMDMRVYAAGYNSRTDFANATAISAPSSWMPNMPA
jgi:hypothetical protein